MSNQKNSFRLWKVRFLRIFLCLSAFRLSLGHELPRSCERRGSLLSCSLRTIGSQKVLLPAHISELHVLCSDILLFESYLEHTDQQNKTSGFLFQLNKLISLRIDYCKIRNVPPKVFAAMVQLKSLILRTHNNDWAPMMLDLSAESFSGLRELRHLDLSDNNIWTLPSEVFCHLHNLKTLNLTRNRIRDVNQLGFSNQNEVATSDSCDTAIEDLDLSQNEIIQIEDNFLIKLRSLVSLYLQQNAITFIGNRALTGLTMLQVLNLSSNFISSVPSDFLQASRDIKQIYLNKNNLSVLSPGSFDGLEQLQVLDLSNNELTSRGLNKDSFLGLVRMIVLNLAHNSIVKLDSLTFRNLYSLQILNLDHNLVEYISDDSFVELKNLHALTLSHNKIKSIGLNYFSELYVLNQLYLDHNCISYIHQNAFQNLTNLQDLCISANELNEVPEAIKNLRFLKSLDLGRNNISILLNSSFEGLDKLYGLRLVDNKISRIVLNSFKNLPSLQVLNLASNKIISIEVGSFDMNPSLKAIRLDGNKLREIRGLFERLSSLGWLNVSDNELTRFSYENFPSNLEWLNINTNMLKSLPNCETVNSSLKMLDVSCNKIENITGKVIPRTVEHLYLNDNNIKSVQMATFLHKNSLVKVLLYGNAIQTMDIGALALSNIDGVKDVPDFYISGNPFKCDCSMEWLQRINQLAHTRQYPRIGDLEIVTCSLTHSRGTGAKRVLELKPSQFLCPYDTHCFALCHCCDFDACDCEMTCPKNCTCYHDLTWTANVVDCSNSGYTRVPAKIPMDATELYLDGNDFKDLGSHVFIGKKKLQVLFLNNSNLYSVHNRTFKGVESLKVLHLENNMIQELRGDEFDQLHNLNEIYLDHNSISSVGNDTFKAMKNLQVLRLDENKIVNFSPWQLLASSSGSIPHVSLEGNKWSCDCHNIVRLDSWLRMNARDAEELFCFGNNHERETITTVLSRCETFVENSLATSVEHPDTLQNYFEPTFIGQNYISIFASIFITAILVCMIGALIFAFRQDFRLWAYSRYGIRLFKGNKKSNSSDFESDRLHDAYVIYSIEDEQFVTTAISSELEQSGYSVCLHYRDIHAKRGNGDGNSCIAESISSATEASKRIVVILTINFLSLEWVNDDLRISLLSTLKSLRLSGKSKKIIFILSTDVSALNLEADLQVYLRSHGVFYWGEKRFWDKLHFAMPDVVYNKTTIANSTHSLKNQNFRYKTTSDLAESVHRYHKTLPPPCSVLWSSECGGHGGLESGAGCSGTQGRATGCSIDRGRGRGRGRTYFV